MELHMISHWHLWFDVLFHADNSFQMALLSRQFIFKDNASPCLGWTCPGRLMFEPDNSMQRHIRVTINLTGSLVSFVHGCGSLQSSKAGQCRCCKGTNGRLRLLAPLLCVLCAESGQRHCLDIATVAKAQLDSFGCLCLCSPWRCAEAG